MKRFIVLMFAMLLVFSAACNQKGAGTNGGSASGEPGSTSGSGGPARDSVVYAISASPSTLDPCFRTSSDEWQIMTNLYDTLFFNYSQDGERKPRIAESYTISEDGLTYTFNIRKGIKFHDGTELKASDVAFTASLAINSPYISYGLESLREEGISVVDEYTVQFTLDEVSGPFFRNISMLFILPEDYYTSAGAEAFANAPIGSGPYSFVSFEEAKATVTLESFDDYYRGSAPIKTLLYRAIEDQNTANIALEMDEVDVALVMPSNYQKFAENKGIHLIERESFESYYIAINNEAEPFNNKLVRQAINYALDRQGIIDMVAEGLGFPNSNVLGRVVFGYSENVKAYDYNLEKAKELIAQSGVATPINAGTMICVEHTARHAQAVQQSLSEIGIVVEIEQLETNTFVATTSTDGFTMGIISIGMGEDASMYAMMLSSDAIGGFNFARYSNPQVDELFAAGGSTADDAERLELYEELFQIVSEDAPYAILYNPLLVYAHNANMHLEISTDGAIHFFDCKWNQ